jgi:hypothetical protein
MAQDALLTLADDQSLASAWNDVGYMISEHNVNTGATQDAFNGVQMFAVLTVKTAFTSAAADDTIQVLIKNGASGAFISAAAQEINPVLAQSSRFLATDLYKGRQVVLALSPVTASSIAGAFNPQGKPVVYGLLIGQDSGQAPVSFTGGVFDLELRTENVRGQKYYPQATSVG